MFVIRLFCNEGMSTSILVNKMKTAAQNQGIEVDIAAYPAGDMADHLDGVDCVLLGPQVGYMKAKLGEIAASRNVPMDVIPMVDYGMCNGEKVLAFARNLAGK